MTTAIAIIEEVQVSALQVFTEKGMDPLLGKIEEQVRAFVPDLSTAKGRKEIASIAYKVAQSKTVLDNMGKDLTAEWKKKAKVVDAERKKMRERLDALKVEVRQPLTEFEEAEARRKAELEQRIDSIRSAVPTHDTDGNWHPASVIRSGLESLKDIAIDESYGDRINDAALAKEQTIAAIEKVVAEREEHERQQAELERLRKEAAEREQKEREERIRREAEEKAKREAEEAARKERERVELERLEAQKKAQEELDRIAREKAEAEAAIIREREEAKRREEEAERKRLAELQEEKERAEKAKAEAEARRLADIKAAEEKAEREKVELIRQQQEKERLERERKEAEAEAERKRQADVEHRKTINNNILAAFVSLGCDGDVAKAIISAMAKGQVPHVEVKY